MANPSVSCFFINNLKTDRDHLIKKIEIIALKGAIEVFLKSYFYVLVKTLRLAESPLRIFLLAPLVLIVSAVIHSEYILMMPMISLELRCVNDTSVLFFHVFHAYSFRFACTLSF